MKIKREGDGWICSKDKKDILHKNVEIRLFGKGWQISGENLERWTGEGWVMKG